MKALTILTSSTGRSFLSVSTKPIRLTTFMPECTRPKYNGHKKRFMLQNYTTYIFNNG